MRKIMVLFLVVFLLSGCTQTSVKNEYSAAGPTEITIPEDTTETAAVAITGTERLTKMYSIEELTEYFGPYCTTYENEKSNCISDTNVYKYEKVTERFPNGSLKTYIDQTTQYIYAYSIFEVTSGGRYYVFWGGNIEGVISEEWFNNRYVAGMLYVTSLKSIEDFSALEIGKSTAEDVTQIDSGTYFDFGMGRGTPSWNLLDDGSVLEILYEKNEQYYKTFNRSDLIIKSIEIVDKKVTHCYLAYISPDDLP